MRLRSGPSLTVGRSHPCHTANAWPDGIVVADLDVGQSPMDGGGVARATKDRSVDASSRIVERCLDRWTMDMPDEMLRRPGWDETRTGQPRLERGSRLAAQHLNRKPKLNSSLSQYHQALRACSSVDRASASGAEGRRFESCRARHSNSSLSRAARPTDSHLTSSEGPDPLTGAARSGHRGAPDPITAWTYARTIAAMDAGHGETAVASQSAYVSSP